MNPDRPVGRPAGAVAEPSAALAERLAKYGIPPELLRHSLAHRSYCAENPSQPSNERLELLGDAVLGLVITDYLYATYPELPEGDLARVKAASVSTLALAPVAEALELGDAILLGRGEEVSGGRQKASILADCLEAVIGAVYLAAGTEGAKEWVLSIFEEHVKAIAGEARLGDPKNRLQELAAQRGLGSPTYLMSESGPDHAKQFMASALLNGEHLGSGVGKSKKDAERRAAEAALASLAGAGSEETDAGTP